MMVQLDVTTICAAAADSLIGLRCGLKACHCRLHVRHGGDAVVGSLLELLHCLLELVDVEDHLLRGHSHGDLAEGGGICWSVTKCFATMTI